MLELLYKIPEKLADLLVRLRAEQQRRDQETARYFTELANTLDAMITKLTDREIPHAEGHKFGTLIHSFEKKTKSLTKALGPGVSVTDLKDIAEKASMLDVALFVHLPDVEEARDEWLRVMKRMAGDCRGIAAVLDRGT